MIVIVVKKLFFLIKNN